MTSLALAFAGGLAGSLHCVGMCGGLAALMGGERRRVALYNLARVNTYTALGAIAGAVGTAIVAWAPFDAASRLLAIVGGVAVLAVGLQWLGLLAPRGSSLVVRLQGALATQARALVEARSPWAPIAFGTANAFLPCHLIYAFVAVAAATGSVAGGALTMLAFGLGTLPAMTVAGSTRAILRGSRLATLGRAAGALVVVMGVVTIARAFGGAHHH